MFLKILEELIDDNNAFFGTVRNNLGFEDPSKEENHCGFFEIVNRVPAVMEEIGRIIYSEVDPVGTFVKYLPFIVYVLYSDIKIIRLKSRISGLKNKAVGQKPPLACLTYDKPIQEKNEKVFAKTREKTSEIKFNLVPNVRCKSCIKVKKATKKGPSILTASPHKSQAAHLLKMTVVNAKKKVPTTKNQSVQVDMPSRTSVQSLDTTEAHLLGKAIALKYISTSYMKIVRSKSRSHNSVRVQPAEEPMPINISRQIVDSGVNHSYVAVAPKLTENVDNEVISYGVHSIVNEKGEGMKVLARNQKTMDRVLEGNTPLYEVQGLEYSETVESRPIKLGKRTMSTAKQRNPEIVGEIKYFEFTAPQDPGKMFLGEFYNRFYAKPGHSLCKEHVIKAVSMKLAMKRLTQKESLRTALTQGLHTPRAFCGLDGNRATVLPISREAPKEEDKGSRPPLYWRIKDRERFKRYEALLKCMKTSKPPTVITNPPKPEFSEIIFPQSSIVSAMGPTVSVNYATRATDDPVTPIKPKFERSTVEQHEVKTVRGRAMKPNVKIEITNPKPVPPQVSIKPDSVKPYKYSISDLFQDSVVQRKPTRCLRNIKTLRPSHVTTEMVHRKEEEGNTILNKMPEVQIDNSYPSVALPQTNKVQKTMQDLGTDSSQVSSSDIKMNKAARRRAEFIKYQSKGFLGQNNKTSILPNSPRYGRSAMQTVPKLNLDSYPSSSSPSP